MVLCHGKTSCETADKSNNIHNTMSDKRFINVTRVYVKQKENKKKTNGTNRRCLIAVIDAAHMPLRTLADDDRDPASLSNSFLASLNET